MLHKTHSRNDKYEYESRRHSNTGSRSFITHIHSHSLAENQFQFNCKIPGNYVVNVLFLVVRFGSKYSQRFFIWIQCVPIEIEHEKFTKNTETMPRSGSGDRERERETRRRRQVWKDWRAEPTELSQAESSQVAALRCVELRYLSGSWTLTEQSGGRVRLHERWYAATRVASHVSDRYMCECVYVQRKYLIDDL